MWEEVEGAALRVFPDGHAARSNRMPVATLGPTARYEHMMSVYGGYGECVETPEALPAALERALHAVKVEKRQALLNLIVGPRGGGRDAATEQRKRPTVVASREVMVQKIFVALSAALVLAPAQGRAAEKVKIGFISSLSNPSLAAGAGAPRRLQARHRGRPRRGPASTLIVNDDQGKPDIGVQLARKMIDEDKVQIITGMCRRTSCSRWRHAVLPHKVFVVSVQAGPSQFAGAECNPYFFAASDETDTASEAMGNYINKTGTKKL